MNIKIVYKKNVHKLPGSTRSLKDLKASLSNIYKISEMQKVIFCSPMGELLEIINEEQFQQIVKANSETGLSLKFLISDNEVQNIPQEDLIILNRSMIMINQNKQQEPIPQQQFQQPKKEILQDNQNQFNDCQKQEIKRELIQVNNKGDNLIKQNEVEQMNIAELIKSDEFQRFMNNFYEEKLKQSGLLDEIKVLRYQQDILLQALQGMEEWKNSSSELIKKLKCQQEDIKIEQESNKYQSEVMQLSNHTVVTTPSSQFTWKVQIRNNGLYNWPQQLKLKCIAGPYEGVDEDVKSLLPTQNTEVLIPLEAVSSIGTFYCIWKLCYTVNGKEVFFGKEICFYLKVDPEEEQVSQKYKNSQILIKAQAVKKVLTDEQLQKICVFIETNKLQNQIPQSIIDQYLEQYEDHKQPKYQKQYKFPEQAYHKPTGRWGKWGIFGKDY